MIPKLFQTLHVHVHTPVPEWSDWQNSQWCSAFACFPPTFGTTETNSLPQMGPGRPQFPVGMKNREQIINWEWDNFTTKNLYLDKRLRRSEQEREEKKMGNCLLGYGMTFIPDVVPGAMLLEMWRRQRTVLQLYQKDLNVQDRLTMNEIAAGD